MPRLLCIRAQAYDNFIKSGAQKFDATKAGNYEFFGYTNEGIKIKFGAVLDKNIFNF